MNINVARAQQNPDAKSPAKKKGEFPLTPRSQSMLKTYTKNKLVKEIAAHLKLKTLNQVLKSDNKELLQRAIVSNPMKLGLTVCRSTRK